MGRVKPPSRAIGLGLLAGMLASGCASGPPHLARSIAVDCRPGDSSVVCCIKKYPATAAESCGATALEVAEVLNGTRVLNEAATAAEEDLDEEDTDDFANKRRPSRVEAAMHQELRELSE